MAQEYSDSDGQRVEIAMKLNLGMSFVRPSSEVDSENEATAKSAHAKIIQNIVQISLVNVSLDILDELSSTHIIQPVVEYCSKYCQRLLFDLPKEKYTKSSVSAGVDEVEINQDQQQEQDELVDCSAGKCV